MTKKETGAFCRRKLEDLNLLNDFLFQEMMAQEGVGEEFCRILLETILEKTIRKVQVIPQKNIPGINTNMHGIRLDAYIEAVSQDDIETSDMGIDAKIQSDIYDVEPNKKYGKKSLPRRTRYYHALIDTQLLATEVDYEKLQNVVIIMILPYDPFERKRMVYTIQNQCVEDPTVCYDDGAKKIFLYTKGTEGNPSKKLRDMLKYIEESVDRNVTNPEIAHIQRLVKKVKESKEVGINYMKTWEREKMIREEGKAEGKERMIKTFVLAYAQEGKSEEEVIGALIKYFQLKQEAAKTYYDKYMKETVQ